MGVVWVSFILVSATLFFVERKFRGTLVSLPQKTKIKVVNLRIRRSFGKTLVTREIKLFNKMRLAMECQGGLPIAYINYLGRLYINPQFRPKKTLPEFKVLYLYAVLNLRSKEKCPLRLRQLQKNLLFVYRSFMPVIKRNVIISRVTQGTFFVFKQPSLKIIGNRVQRLEGIAYPSYIKNQRFKHFSDKSRKIECYEALDSGPIEIKVADDKTQWNIGHALDTIYMTNRKQATVHAIYTTQKEPVFQTTIAKKKKALEVKIDAKCGAKVFHIIGQTKQDVQSQIALIKDQGHRLDYLLKDDQADIFERAEQIINSAFYSRYISGDNLVDACEQVKKMIPTILNPTYVCENIPQLDVLKLVAALGVKLNIVVLSSSQNTDAQKIIESFISKKEVRALINSNILFFFVDRMKASAAVVSFLSSMQEARQQKICQSHERILVSVQTALNVTSIFLTNTLNKLVKGTAVVPLSLVSGFAIYKKIGRKLFVRDTEFKLPFNCTVNGVEDGTEFITDKLWLQLDITLKSFEERILEVVKKVGIVLDNVA